LLTMFAASARCAVIGSPVSLHFECNTHAAGIDQTNDTTIGRVHAAPQFERSELGAFGSDPYVAGHGQFEPAAQDPTIAGGDDRLVDPVAGRV